MANDPSSDHRGATRRVAIAELAAAQGVVPMGSTEEWAGDLFESDEDLAAFLSDVRASRDASLNGPIQSVSGERQMATRK